MEQSVDTADIYKCTVIGESHYRTLYYIADIEVFPNLCDQLLLLLVEEKLMREYRSVSSLIHSRNPYFHRLADKLVSVLNVVIRKLRKRNESRYFLVFGYDSSVYCSSYLNFEYCFIFKCLDDFVPVSTDFQLFL